MNIYEHKILQGFQGTHVADRTCSLQGPFIENCSELKLIIYSLGPSCGFTVDDDTSLLSPDPVLAFNSTHMGCMLACQHYWNCTAVVTSPNSEITCQLYYTAENWEARIDQGSSLFWRALSCGKSCKSIATAT